MGRPETLETISAVHIRNFQKAIMNIHYSKLLKSILIALIFLPPLYLFVMIQYSAITFPFWDHVDLVRFLAAFHDHTLHFSDLVSPHNQTRPLTYRIIYILNAILTGWDIRSEYVYMYAALYSTWAIHVFFIWSVFGKKFSTNFIAATLIVTIFMFSPVGHNNHWWSMMLQLNLANMLIATALLTVALRPDSWRAHVFAVCAAWLASYTLTNGIFVFLTVIVSLQLSRPRLLSFDRAVCFWLINLIVLLFVYLPGVPLDSGPHPTLLAMARFTLVYLGNPVVSLLWFPFKSQFDIPLPTLANGFGGLIIVAAALVIAWRARARLQKRQPEDLAFCLFAGFAAISAVATAWGRAAFDSYAVSNANASRYSIFAVYLTLGLFYNVAPKLAGVGDAARDALNPRQRFLGLLVLIAFVVASAVTYGRAVRVYHDSHEFNNLLAQAFIPGGGATEYDRLVYPKLDRVVAAKAELISLRLGPYRASPAVAVSLASDRFAGAVPLLPGHTLTQRFRSQRAGLYSLSLPVVTWGGRPSSYVINWYITIISEGQRQPVASGKVDASSFKDWQTLGIDLPQIAAGLGTEFELRFEAAESGSVTEPLGFPLFQPAAGSVIESATMNGASAIPGAVLHLSLLYGHV
jgi:hypothetical protein